VDLKGSSRRLTGGKFLQAEENHEISLPGYQVLGPIFDLETFQNIKQGFKPLGCDAHLFGFRNRQIDFGTGLELDFHSSRHSASVDTAYF
jgi:hypothetical protein